MILSAKVLSLHHLLGRHSRSACLRAVTLSCSLMYPLHSSAGQITHWMVYTTSPSTALGSTDPTITSYRYPSILISLPPQTCSQASSQAVLSTSKIVMPKILHPTPTPSQRAASR